jgi:hypothetical protein
MTRLSWHVSSGTTATGRRPTRPGRESTTSRVRLIAQPLATNTFCAMTENRILTLTLSIPAPLATHLWSSATPNFVSEHPDRLWSFDHPELPDPHSPVFRDGTMMWTESMDDALILRACEEQLGHATTLLFDETGFSDGPIILSSRPFRSWEEGEMR